MFASSYFVTDPAWPWSLPGVGVAALFGVALGLPLAFLGARWLAALLFEVSPHDPLTFVTVPAVVLLAALAACGVPCPRDTDMQEKALGSALARPHEPTQLRRGDLVFWKGHVAIARNPATLIHANAFHMAVAIEPTVDAIARIHAGGSEVTSLRRLNQS